LKQLLFFEDNLSLRGTYVCVPELASAVRGRVRT